MVLRSSFPEITTFGSLIRFALELEKVATSLYEGSSKTYPNVAALPLLADVHRKRSQLLEHTRQQKLNEMILEPIYDLNGNNYAVDVNGNSASALKELIKTAEIIEDKSARFYSDSARLAKSLLAESSRIFQKMAKENDDNKSKLKTIAS
ncbi:MAG TPA: hypothetical protein VMX95_10225 [Thermodesulfobacteriota bacterium]|nr:hypothetical protein [Thermodesulfobacteriota bacterium]